MSELTDFDLDQTGKIDLNDIYDQPDPRDYYQTIIHFDYRIPTAAEPVFRSVIATLRKDRQQRHLTILDVGSSYGVNASILKYNCDLFDLFNLYSESATAALSRCDLLSRDRAFLDGRDADRDLKVIGLDSADKAVSYACDAGVMDAGIATNLETQSPTERDGALLAEVDLVISTGAIGYVGAPTFRRVLGVTRSRPWFALFALRMFPIDPIAAILKQRGYEVFRLVGQTFRQRRFGSDTEAAEVLANLAQLGIDPAGRESEGWFHAEFYFAQPTDEAASAPIANLIKV